MSSDSAASSGSWPPGYMVRPRVEGPSPEWLERFRNIPTSWASDNMGRSVGSVGLNSYHNDVDLMIVATAVTVRVRPGDNLMIHKAMEIAQRGDVIIVDGAGDLTQALIGANMRATAIQKGFAGFVLDGAVRDLSDWAKGEMAIWARGHTHRGPSKDGPGEVNVPISCAGMVVHPGDLILGDADGVLAIPQSALASLWPLVQKQAEREAHLQAINKAGTADPERFNSILRAKGCPV